MNSVASIPAAAAVPKGECHINHNYISNVKTSVMIHVVIETFDGWVHMTQTSFR